MSKDVVSKDEFSDERSSYISCMLSPLFYKIITVSLGLRGVRGLELGLRQQRTIGSSKCLWSFCFHVGQKLMSRLTVVAGGPSANVPATKLGKYERWLSGASTGPVGNGYDNRPGELTVTCRNRHASYAFV
ncbi:hypothetical protein PIB30_051293 [Stylosanthes scabra]|uniref:Uncharacterized protein n=1 Tax=Stylosanthes scabra TaxID=79078 RepID=A0ABU6XJ31_9FABA|nr:hypothetical protein [Stylosanthes scabra]